MNEPSQIPKILYHGTTGIYVERALSRFDKYAHSAAPIEDYEKVWLTDEIQYSVAHAIGHAIEFKATPVLLVVDVSKVACPLEIISFSDAIICDYLDKESFHKFELKREDYKGLSSKAIKGIELIVKKIMEEK